MLRFVLLFIYLLSLLFLIFMRNPRRDSDWLISQFAWFSNQPRKTSQPGPQAFAKIKSSDYAASYLAIQRNPLLYTKASAATTMMSEAIDAEMDGKTTYAQNCVHQYLVLQNCRRLYVRDPNCSMLSKWVPISPWIHPVSSLPNWRLLNTARVLSGQWAPHVSIEEIKPVYKDILRRVPGLRQLRQFVHGTQDVGLWGNPKLF
jgi:hypothetical protein